MGTMYYGGESGLEIDDRTLAHLRVVITTKLRRSESFTVSWRHPADERPGRTTLWIHCSIPLRFVFDDPEQTELNREWINELANSASSASGIVLTEDLAPVAAAQRVA